MIIRCLLLVSITCWCFLSACVPDLPDPSQEGMFRCTSGSDCMNGYICAYGYCWSEMGDGGMDGQGEGDDGQGGEEIFDGNDRDGDSEVADLDGGSSGDDSDCQITHQGQEWCDGLDNDCDGETDENCIECQIDSDCNEPPADFCDADTRVYYPSIGSCSGGQCDYLESREYCDFGCANGMCGGDPCGSITCDSGEQCIGGACRCGGSGPDCVTGTETCCGTSCVDTDTNPGHCGTCNNVCDSGEQCVFGGCHCGGTGPDCLIGETCCGTSCEDLNNDSSNCGACGNHCNNNAYCMSGNCTCVSFYGNCDGSWTNGCEQSLETLQHCGACNTNCSLPHAAAACPGGFCRILACDSLWGDCDGSDGNGCEQSLETVQHCGSCNYPCQRGHAETSCSGGTCTIEYCYTDWENCDGSDLNGCEANINLSDTDCGACGSSCPVEASSSCGTNGRCDGTGNCALLFLSLCYSVTSPVEYWYDVCVDGFCISPGTCDDGSCNTPGPHFEIPPSEVHSDFTRSGVSEPVVTDNVTGLVWQGCTSGFSGERCLDGDFVLLNWWEALSYCDQLSWGGYSDWYLPDRYELYSIVDFSHCGSYEAAIDPDAFPETPGGTHWVSSMLVGHYGSENAWAIRFDGGLAGHEMKTSPWNVRCVRRGP